MAGRKKIPQSARELSKLEREVMNIIWDKGKVTAKEIKYAIEETNPLALTTILTVLSRLLEKEFVKEVPSLGRSKVFQATVAREAVAFDSLKKVMKNFFKGSPAAMMSQLIKHEAVSRDEMDDIRRMLEDIEHNQTKEGGGSDV